jgi:hypothetical protein
MKRGETREASSLSTDPWSLATDFATEGAEDAEGERCWLVFGGST